MKSFLLAALIFALAQQTPPSKPAIRSGITVVEVDVVVADKAGRPVRGLRQEDFEIFEDGRPVQLATFSAVDLPEAVPQPAIQPLNQSGSAFASNDRADGGRLILIVLDDVQMAFTAGRMATVKSIARRTVERLGPSDVAGVITTSGRLGGQAEFTTDKYRLLEAIERFRPQGEHELPSIASAPPAMPGANPQAERIIERRTRSAMAGLTVAARALGSIQHRRKGVLLLSQGFPATLEQIIRDPRIGAAHESIREFILTAQRSNVAVYTVDPCGLEVDAGCNRHSRQNLRTIAETTGGFAVINTNASDAAVDRMLAENGSYYMIGYSSPAPPNDGKHHRITVRTRIADVEIRAREGYDSPPKRVSRSAATPLEALTAAAIQTAGLTMRVVAIPAPLSTAPAATVILGVELPASVASRARRIEFAAVAIDREGKTRARTRFTTDFTASQAGAATWTRTGSRIDVPPGDYQIRVAAVGSDDSRGSVFTEVSVPRFDTELGVGGLSLGAASSAAVTDADRLRGVLTLIPLAGNEIPPGTTVTAQLPIRASSKSASGALTITATLIKPDGTTRTLDRTQTTGREYANATGKVYRATLPSALAAGRYLVRVEGALGRATFVREVTFSVLPDK